MIDSKLALNLAVEVMLLPVKYNIPVKELIRRSQIIERVVSFYQQEVEGRLTYNRETHLELLLFFVLMECRYYNDALSREIAESYKHNFLIQTRRLGIDRIWNRFSGDLIEKTRDMYSSVIHTSPFIDLLFQKLENKEIHLPYGYEVDLIFIPVCFLWLLILRESRVDGIDSNQLSDVDKNEHNRGKAIWEKLPSLWLAIYYTVADIVEGRKIMTPNRASYEKIIEKIRMRLYAISDLETILQSRSSDVLDIIRTKLFRNTDLRLAV